MLLFLASRNIALRKRLGDQYNVSRAAVKRHAQRLRRRGLLFREGVLTKIATGRVRLSTSVKARQAQLRDLKRTIIARSVKARKGIASLWRLYGWVGIGTYISIYALSLASLFLVVKNGAISGQDALRLVSFLHLSDRVDVEKLNSVDSWWGQFLVAWVLTKVVEPLRALLTLAITPFIARFFRRRRLARGLTK